MNSKDTNLLKNNNINIGSILQQARISNHYTQDEVAEMLGCATRYVSSLERNKVNGSIPMILSLCNLYNLSLDKLYGQYLNDYPCSELSGFYRLNKEHKQIIIKNISLLNEIEQSNTKA